jgi:hypothetical protein
MRRSTALSFSLQLVFPGLANSPADSLVITRRIAQPIIHQPNRQPGCQSSIPWAYESL